MRLLDKYILKAFVGPFLFGYLLLPVFSLVQVRYSALLNI